VWRCRGLTFHVECLVCSMYFGWESIARVGKEGEISSRERPPEGYWPYWAIVRAVMNLSDHSSIRWTSGISAYQPATFRITEKTSRLPTRVFPLL